RRMDLERRGAFGHAALGNAPVVKYFAAAREDLRTGSIRERAEVLPHFASAGGVREVGLSPCGETEGPCACSRRPSDSSAFRPSVCRFSVSACLRSRSLLSVPSSVLLLASTESILVTC